MAKSIKFKDNIYLDTSSISHKKGNTREPLNTYLNSIIESGQNENGWWFKNADGTMVCTKTLAGTPNSVDLWDNIIYYKDISVGNWAKTFTALIDVQVSSSTLQYWCNINNANETSGGTVRLLRPSNNPLYYEVQILAIGRWK